MMIKWHEKKFKIDYSETAMHLFNSECMVQNTYTYIGRGKIEEGIYLQK